MAAETESDPYGLLAVALVALEWYIERSGERARERRDEQESALKFQAGLKELLEEHGLS